MLHNFHLEALQLGEHLVQLRRGNQILGQGLIDVGDGQVPLILCQLHQLFDLLRQVQILVLGEVRLLGGRINQTCLRDGIISPGWDRGFLILRLGFLGCGLLRRFLRRSRLCLFRGSLGYRLGHFFGHGFLYRLLGWGFFLCDRLFGSLPDRGCLFGRWLGCFFSGWLGYFFGGCFFLRASRLGLRGFFGLAGRCLFCGFFLCCGFFAFCCCHSVYLDRMRVHSTL